MPTLSVSFPRAVGNMFSTLFWPLIPFLLQVMFFLYWAGSALYPCYVYSLYNVVIHCCHSSP